MWRTCCKAEEKKRDYPIDLDRVWKVQIISIFIEIDWCLVYYGHGKKSYKNDDGWIPWRVEFLSTKWLIFTMCEHFI